MWGWACSANPNIFLSRLWIMLCECNNSFPTQWNSTSMAAWVCTSSRIWLWHKLWLLLVLILPNRIDFFFSGFVCCLIYLWSFIVYLAVVQAVVWFFLTIMQWAASIGCSTSCSRLLVNLLQFFRNSRTHMCVLFGMCIWLFSSPARRGSNAPTPFDASSPVSPMTSPVSWTLHTLCLTPSSHCQRSESLRGQRVCAWLFLHLNCALV